MKTSLFAVMGVLIMLGAGCVSQPTDRPDRPDRNRGGVEADPQGEPVNENLTIESPSAGDVVTNPIQVTGVARTFEQHVDWRLLDGEGEVLTEGFTTADAIDIGQHGPYEFWIVVPAVSDPNLVIEVFQYSAKDGSVVDLAWIPVTLERTSARQIELHFLNDLMDPAVTCNTTFDVEREIVTTVATARTAALLLLNGPTAEEESVGFETSIPRFTKLNDVSIDDGLLTIDLGGGIIGQVDTACKAEAIEAQIRNTMLQFDTVNDVKILLNGEEAPIWL